MVQVCGHSPEFGLIVGCNEAGDLNDRFAQALINIVDPMFRANQVLIRWTTERQYVRIDLRNSVKPARGATTMDVTTAMKETSQLVTGLISGLTPDHREASTPCDNWNVHELIDHMVGGAHGIAGGMEGMAPPDEMPDFLADGPANGWAQAAAHLAAASTPENLAASHQMPFGEVPGEMAVSVITADLVTHAWDLAKATGQDLNLSDELAQFALDAWMPLVPAEGRTGDGFKAAVPVGEGASAIDRLVAYTGRQP